MQREGARSNGEKETEKGTEEQLDAGAQRVRE